jgi:hypothetical protein
MVGRRAAVRRWGAPAVAVALGVLGLQLLASLPGAVCRLASGAALLITPRLGPLRARPAPRRRPAGAGGPHAASRPYGRGGAGRRQGWPSLPEPYRPLLDTLGPKLDPDSIRIVDGSYVALGCATLRNRRYLDPFHHKPENRSAPLQGPASPFLNRPLLAQGFP